MQPQTHNFVSSLTTFIFLPSVTDSIALIFMFIYLHVSQPVQFDLFSNG